MSVDLGRDPYWAHNLDPEELTMVRAALELRREAQAKPPHGAEVSDEPKVAQLGHALMRWAR